VRAGGPLGTPDQVDQILRHRLQASAPVLLDALVQLLCNRAGDKSWVEADSFAPGRLIGCPLLPGGNILKALLQQRPVTIQLLGSLVEIPAIGCQSGLVLCDDGSARRTAKARNKATSTIAVGDILGCVAVFRRYNCA